MSNKYLLSFFIFFLSIVTLQGQHQQWSSSDIQIHLEKLNTLGSVLYFAAHPDDENTRLIAWLAQEKKYRTGYLSLTRGEGGQNLIGIDLGVDLGLVRTHELLAARHIDKGEQFFSSAFDFGFSKTHEETFRFWDKRSILAEAVYIIRKFRPDVIITRFPPDKRGGHGHHQASAILAHEAFVAAADATQFPEQLTEVKPWQATRLVWNTANFGGMNNTSESQLKVEIGDYNPLLGQSYGEIAARSRSQHKSQGFGSASTRGRQVEYFEHIAGKKARTSLMDDINTSWSRITGTENIQRLVDKVIGVYRPGHPEKIVTDLFALRKAIQSLPDEYWRAQKTKEVEELIVACAGVWVDAVTHKPTTTVADSTALQLEAIVRNPDNSVTLAAVNGRPVQHTLAFNTVWKGSQSISWPSSTQPYWLEQPHSLGKFVVAPENIGKPLNTDRPAVDFVFDINGERLEVRQAIHYRFVDPVQGEMHQPLAVMPVLTASVASNNFLRSNEGTQSVPVTFHLNDPEQSRFKVEVEAPQGWDIRPSHFELKFDGEARLTDTLHLRRTAKDAPRKASVSLTWNGQPLRSVKTVAYDHVPSITWFPELSIQLEYFDLENPIKKVGYIAGAGDLIPQALANIGIEVSTLTDKQIDADYLKQFDAVVIGVRYFNVDEKSKTALPELMKYVAQGGVVLAQYNVNSRLHTERLGPYPFVLSRDRVTEEDSEVDFDQHDPAMNYPNKITAADFDNWVQERGLYFATAIDPAYRTPIRMHDEGEASSRGSLLVAKYGKGKFVYTSLSFFRQLPAGVPGAYRLFVNLLTKEK